MAGTNVGLISGMDTASLITQLMQVEANPQTLLKGKLADTQADAKAYRAVNTKFDALRTAAEALTKATAWGAAKASSSSTGVTANASATSAPGTLTFSVTSVAATHAVISAGKWDSTSEALGLTAPLQFSHDGVTTDIPLPDGATLADAVTAINAADKGVTATAISTKDGYRLQVGATAATGAASVFSLAGAEGADTDFPPLVQGTDAEIHVGGAVNGYDVTSPTNTFSDVLPGTTFTVSPTSDKVTLSVTGDPDAVATAVGALVKAANDVLSSIAAQTSTTTGSVGVLKGDSTLRALSSKVLETVSTAIGDTGSASTAGIQLDRYGQLVFDSATFVSALKADPALAQRLVNGAPADAGTPAVQGVAQRLLALAKTATDSTTGTLTLKAKSGDTEATDLQSQIDDWDRRLEIRKATLTAQFTAMETMLGTLQNQSSWLSSQIKSLPSSSSSR
jgi:flagellar hook-associated protein 2